MAHSLQSCSFNVSNLAGSVFLKTVIICNLLFSAGPEAKAEAAPEAKRLKDRAEIAQVLTSGNTNISTLSVKNALEYDFNDRITGAWNLGVLNGEQNGEINAERYSTDLRLDYLLGQRFYAYLLAGWLNDRFIGLDNRYNVGPGLGYKIFVGPKHFMKAEVGANWTREDYTARETEDFIESRLSVQYSYALSDKSKFEQGLNYLQDYEDLENSKIVSTTALISSINKLLAIKLSYEVRYQNRPITEDVEKTDTIFSGALMVTY